MEVAGCDVVHSHRCIRLTLICYLGLGRGSQSLSRCRSSGEDGE
jgi:hypothetical protein